MFHIRRKIWHLQECFKFWRFIEFFDNNESGDSYPVYSRLCTACHILDKGLHIRNFEAGHGKSVYQRAKRLEAAIPADSALRGEDAFKWCLEVISDYEAAQENGAPVYPEIKVTMDESELAAFDHLCSSQISCRDFLPDEIPDSIWEKTVRLAITAPNSCCRQSTRFHIVHDSEIVKKLALAIAGATGFNQVIPYLIIVSADLRVYSACDHRLPYIDAALALDRFTLAARAYGIYSTILNFEHATEQERSLVHSVLNIPKSQRIIITLAAGRPAKLPAKPGRMSIGHFWKMYK